ncbi:gasdermin-D-like isoform X2 [Vombatus ursinus]|uniref:gasdermin-D-like isoform X2 n=1 Tax=Vombatus ursinus TaxID=29139 RepID=UPI000FFD8CB3|nr:gasdermin-D-like isoform X2 [Vombatus ursinus]
MVCAFEWAAKNVVRELGKNGELIPVDSLKSSTRFSPYCLVRKKTRSSLFRRSQYVCLNLTLKDILDPSSPEPEVTQHGPFHFNDEVDGQVSGSVEVTASVQGKISGQTSVSNKTILKVKTLIVSPNTWDSLQKERTMKAPEPSIIQELQKWGESPYVVTEAMRTQKEAILKRSRKKEGFGKITIPGASCVQGEGQGSLNTMKTVTVPEGSILAFQVAKLIIQDHWNVLLLPDKNQKTFPPKGFPLKRKRSRCIYEFAFGMVPSSRIMNDFSGGAEESCLSGFARTMKINTVLDFEQLQAEVENEHRPLTMLDRELLHFLLQALLGLLQREQDLLDLEDMLEQSLYTGVPPQKVKGMTGDILSNLQDQNGQLVEELAGAFLYLLGALNALSDIQHQLLIQLLQKKEQILSQEVELVKAILKENFNQTKKRTFSLPSELLSFVQGQDEESTIMCDLLEECGLWLSGDDPQFTWNPSALHSLCALYGSLVMLQALTEA